MTRRRDIVVETGLTPAQSAMTEANLGLITYVVQRNLHLLTETYDFHDAWQDGYLGLARAVQKYDPTLGFTFATYAPDLIRAAVQKGRGRAESVAWRAAYEAQQSDDFEFPLSLDAPTDDGQTLTDVIAVAGDIDEVAIANVAIERLYAECRDAFDRAIVDNMVKGDPLQHAARDLGYALGSTSKRVDRLRELAETAVR